MNKGRLVAGGLVAGVIINVAEGVINGGILGQAWKEWAAKTAAINQQPSPGTGMMIWTIMALALGFLGVWLYAAIRPRYGAGPRTALLTAFFLWLTFWVLAALQNMALGTVPIHLVMVGTFGGLIGVIAAMLAGAAIYKEDRSPVDVSSKGAGKL
jgi:hypothetical protein